jgi:excisionase family DNA binding protein
VIDGDHDVVAGVRVVATPGHTPGHQSVVIDDAKRLQRLLPVGDAADYLGVSRATVERLVNRGELPIVKIAGLTRYDVDDLDGSIAINRCRNRRRTA